MNKDYFKDIYTDFFGVEEETLKETNIQQQEMTNLIERINNLYLDDTSKNLFKNIIEYMRKYHEGIEKNYIPFRITIESTGAEDKEISDILCQAALKYNYLDNKSMEVYSFYRYRNDYKFEDSFLVFQDLVGIKLIDTKDEQRFFYNLESFLKENKKNMVLIFGNNIELTNFFLGYENIKNNYFDFHIKTISPDINDIYNKVLNDLNIDDDLKIKVFEYIEKTYSKGIDYNNYIKDLVNYISFHKELPQVKDEKTIDEIFNELDELVGLNDIKKVLHELVDVLTLKEKTEGKLNIKDINLHMVFLGNPGTGKTTIARLISGILYNLGIIKENKLVEVGVKDLVAEYVGQTAPKTSLVIEKSLNGVLFIDEAYALAAKNDNSYNAEAIATLIQAMENYREKLVVIFAGYTKEMQDFLDSNSGIVSRIGYTLNFPDYTTEELIEIFKTFSSKAGFIVETDALNYLKEIISKYRNMKNFGNARFIRNIYEKTIVKHASRVKDKKQLKVLKTITKEDISIENLILE